MSQKGFRKGEELRWPVGASARKVATVAGPLVHIIQCQWLAILSFVDDHMISTMENVAESLFPPSGVLFDKIDSLVDAIESFPRKIDRVSLELETTVRKAAALNPLLNMAINVLDLFIYTVTDPECRETKEKDIIVDERSSRSCAPRNDDAMAETGTEAHPETETEAQPETMKSEIYIQQVNDDPDEVSGKEGKKTEKNKTEKNGAKKRVADIVPAREEDIKEVQEKELIMELFESGWGI